MNNKMNESNQIQNEKEVILKNINLCRKELKRIEIPLINIKILLAHMDETEETRALAKTDDIITSTVKKVEDKLLEIEKFINQPSNKKSS